MSRVDFRVGHKGPQVAVKVSTVGAEIIGLMPPAQARELALTLQGEADRVEAMEGIRGTARRDAFVNIEVQHLLGAAKG